MTLSQQRYRRFLETLTPQSLDNLSDYVSADVHFVDPFNDVTGVDAMTAVFRHMFDNVQDIRFRIVEEADNGSVVFWNWRYDAHLRGKPWHFSGTSVLRFSLDGRVTEHIDYWDSAQHFYERLPIIGSLISGIRSRIGKILGGNHFLRQLWGQACEMTG